MITRPDAYDRTFCWLVLCLLIAFVCPGCGGRTIKIVSASMEPTLLVGDRVSVEPLDGAPLRGAIVVYEVSKDDPDNHTRPNAVSPGEYVHRIIAIPGDRIRIRDGRIVLNGTPLPTEVQGPMLCNLYTRGDDTPVDKCNCEGQRETIGVHGWVAQQAADSCGGPKIGDWPRESSGPLQTFGNKDQNPDWPEMVVPAGEVFLLGDNRDFSADSRSIGFVRVESIRGRVVTVVSNSHQHSRREVRVDGP